MQASEDICGAHVCGLRKKGTKLLAEALKLRQKKNLSDTITLGKKQNQDYISHPSINNSAYSFFYRQHINIPATQREYWNSLHMTDVITIVITLSYGAKTLKITSETPPTQFSKVPPWLKARRCQCAVIVHILWHYFLIFVFQRLGLQTSNFSVIMKRLAHWHFQVRLVGSTLDQH